MSLAGLLGGADAVNRGCYCGPDRRGRAAAVSAADFQSPVDGGGASSLCPIRRCRALSTRDFPPVDCIIGSLAGCAISPTAPRDPAAILPLCPPPPAALACNICMVWRAVSPRRPPPSRIGPSSTTSSSCRSGPRRSTRIRTSNGPQRCSRRFSHISRSPRVYVNTSVMMVRGGQGGLWAELPTSGCPQESPRPGQPVPREPKHRSITDIARGSKSRWRPSSTRLWGSISRLLGALRSMAARWLAGRKARPSMNASKPIAEGGHQVGMRRDLRAT